MDFQYPQALYLLLILPLFLFYDLWALYFEKKRLSAWISPQYFSDLIPNYSFLKLVLLRVLWGLIFLFLILSLANPRYGFEKKMLYEKNQEIFILADLSRSMMAEDVKPSRLERMKFKIQDFLNESQGEKVGLIIFEGQPALLSPLTQDKQALVEHLSYLNPDLISAPGTDFAQALNFAVAQFKNKNSKKAILLLSDGEDHAQDLDESLKNLKENGIVVFSLGVGSSDPSPIPLPKGEGGFKKDEQGNLVFTRLEEVVLKKIASETGGFYVPLSVDDSDIKKIIEEGLQNHTQNSDLKQKEEYSLEKKSQAHWPLALGLFFMILSMLISGLRFSSRALLKTRSLVLVLFFILIPQMLFASWLEDWKHYLGLKAYQKQNYAKALEEFSYLNLAQSSFYSGSSYYRQQLYQNALSAYQKTLNTENLEVKEKAYYNLGNTYYRLKQLDQSIQAYEEALRLKPDDQKAKLNLEFVKKQKEKEENQKKQQEQQNNQDQQKQENQQNQQDQNQKDQSKTQNQSKQENNQKNEGNNSSSQNQNSQTQKQDQKNAKPNQNSQNKNDQNLKDPATGAKQPSSTSPQNSAKENSNGLKQNNARKEALEVLEGVDEKGEVIIKQQIRNQMGYSPKVKKDW